MTKQGKAARPRRWAFMEAFHVGRPGDPYLDRLRVIQAPLFGLYLHRIHRPDRDRDPHDHPWWFASLVLTGSYAETVWPDKHDSRRTVRRSRSRFSLRCLSRDAAHMITVVEGPLRTLVLTGPKDRQAEWGFWRNGQYTPWREYPGRQDGDP